MGLLQLQEAKEAIFAYLCGLPGRALLGPHVLYSILKIPG